MSYAASGRRGRVSHHRHAAMGVSACRPMRWLTAALSLGRAPRTPARRRAGRLHGRGLTLGGFGPFPRCLLERKSRSLSCKKARVWAPSASPAPPGRPHGARVSRVVTPRRGPLLGAQSQRAAPCAPALDWATADPGESPGWPVRGSQLAAVRRPAVLPRCPLCSGRQHSWLPQSWGQIHVGPPPARGRPLFHWFSGSSFALRDWGVSPKKETRPWLPSLAWRLPGSSSSSSIWPQIQPANSLPSSEAPLSPLAAGNPGVWCLALPPRPTHPSLLTLAHAVISALSSLTCLSFLFELCHHFT